METIYRLSRALVLFICCLPLIQAHAGEALYVLDEAGHPHLVTNVTDQFFFYGEGESGRVPILEAKTLLTDSPFRVPGFIHVRKQEAVIHEFSTMGRTTLNKVVNISFEIDIRPNRDFEDLYILFAWLRDDGQETVIACPVGEVQQGRTRKRTYNLSVDESLRNCQYRFVFMSGGLGVLHSETNTAIATPLDQFREKANITELSDGPPKLIRRIVPRPVPDPRDPAAQAAGRVVVSAMIDQQGYVTSAEILESSGPQFSENALEVIQLWEFKPKIVDGKPVETTVKIPLRFAG